LSIGLNLKPRNSQASIAKSSTPKPLIMTRIQPYQTINSALLAVSAKQNKTKQNKTKQQTHYTTAQKQSTIQLLRLQGDDLEKD
jgi:hypothetical protein